MPSSTRSPGFRGLLWTQALGTFADNAFKTYVALWAVGRFGAGDAGRLIAAAGALFVLPFVVLSPLGGAWADRFPKRGLLLKLKAAELALFLLALPALAAGSVPGLMAVLALLGAQAALFGPAKLAVLPELVEDEDLSYANGLVQTTSFMGIVLGTLTAGVLARHPAGERRPRGARNDREEVPGLGQLHAGVPRGGRRDHGRRALQTGRGGHGGPARGARHPRGHGRRRLFLVPGGGPADEPAGLRPLGAGPGRGRAGDAPGRDGGGHRPGQLPRRPALARARRTGPRPRRRRGAGGVLGGLGVHRPVRRGDGRRPAPPRPLRGVLRGAAAGLHP
ncbi:MAG: MFS transporter, partial [Elusimicrobia bacterium]|nr:MFS transporter [Elusimicrobiota bacterium]